MLTSISIISGAALVAAVTGVLGAYYVLSEEAGASTADASSEQVATSPDSLIAKTLGPDSTAQGPDSTARDQDSTAQGGRSMAEGAGGSSEEDQLQALRDSIDTLNRRLQTTRDTTDTLRSKLTEIETDQAKVNELSDALMDMQKRNLGNLLQDVEMSVLKRLYQETAGRARTRLLQSLAPAQAAKFVNQVVEDPDSSSSAGTESMSPSG